MEDRAESPSTIGHPLFPRDSVSWLRSIRPGLCIFGGAVSRVPCVSWVIVSPGVGPEQGVQAQPESCTVWTRGPC